MDSILRGVVSHAHTNGDHMKLMQTAFAGMTGALFAIAAQAADITGAGSTFAAPIYTKWADAYQKTGGGKVNYQGIGSTGGGKKIGARTVDFAGLDDSP